MKIFKKKRFFTTCVALTLAAMLTACGGGNNESASSNQSNNDNSGEAIQDESPFEISIMMNLHTPEVPSDRILKMVEEKTNTILDIQFVPDANYNDRLNTAFATGSLPMVVPMNFQMFNQFKDAIRDEQFWEVGAYLDEFENLSKLKPEILDNTRVDGKIYSLYQGRPLSRQGIIYRKDWADNLGISAPTTVEEFFEMARAFTEDDPNGSGQKDTFGVTDRSDLVYGAFKTIASWHEVPNDFGIKDGQILPEFMFPEYMDTLNYVRDLHSNGYMNQDFPVTSKNDQQALFKNGTAGIYVGSMPDSNSLWNDIRTLNPDAVLDVHNYVEGPQGEYGIWSIPGFGSVVMFPKSSIKTEDELRKVLAFYDAMMTPEISNLLNRGIEGEHYEVIDGGARVLDQNLFDNEVRPYLSLEIGEPETNGRYDAYFEYDVQVKALELQADNENYLIRNEALTLDSDTFVVDGPRLYQIIEDATIRFILGQIDEAGFEAAVENWKSQGGNKIIEEFTASYNAQN
ncbi:ABC transporter substrate-binding protein [Anaerobacillus alkalilacustris]|uniref:ABC transporter substrate-binding protein n=1 Tax=Anaerobacillus alkalilacustris TaxID=393763 RepID=A0A1S2LQ71_9BACI|nr:extracellular solute-binding protein [Anaerobacillus alkalilacustris]OIJ14668.1 ABC transporter substrate-binding protein [Anaerobacillus alkalilacustris]